MNEVSTLDPTAQDAVQQKEDIVLEDEVKDTVENEEITPNNHQ